ncbi:DNA helicase B [Spea bombifrons]|uniref:DNA helicase B n=1 Tax=Spea bombifrons TaxID=233779 RepID=UPI00234AA389|nr:DNA helicase B [Spea bombifrons]
MMSSQRYRGFRRRLLDYQVLRGQLLPVKDEPARHGDADSEGEADDFEDVDPQFLDADEIHQGGVVVNAWSPPKTTVFIKDEDGQQHRVTGPFSLLDPWWSVTVEVKHGTSHYFTQGYPSYELLNDVLGEETMLPLFLSTCKIEESLKKRFLEWLPPSIRVTFSDLREIAEDFHEENNIKIMPLIEKSTAGSIAMKALDIPLVLRYLPRLLPRHVKSLLMMEGKHESHGVKEIPDLLPQVEAILDSSPWKLGFGQIVYRELQLYHCEASWENFLACQPLLEKIPDLQKHALIIYSELKRKCNELGDTYVEQKELTKAVSRDMSTELAWEGMKFLKDNKIVVLEGQRVFLCSLYRYEMDIADYIHRLIKKEPWILDVDADEVLGGAQHVDPEEAFCNDEALGDCSRNPCAKALDEDQKRAVQMICSNPVTVISGKGGCGKTTVVSLVFKFLIRKENKEIEEACKALESDMDASDEWEFGHMTSSLKKGDHMHILLTAPTGKAASLLKKKTDLPSATLHQVTCSFSRWKNRAADIDQKHDWKYSKVEVLVVDEGSLVSVHILSTALKLLYNHGKLAKLIILGDVRQLPSIQPGNLLADIFTALDKMKWAVELRTNHRAESQLIVDNATRISQQTSVEFDAVIQLSNDTDVEMPSEDKRFILVSLTDGSDNELHSAIKKLLEKGPGLQDDKHSQFIAFRRKDCMSINELCCKYYSGHSIKTHKDKLDFRCGDKVCCTKNAYVKDLVTRAAKDGSETEATCAKLIGTEDPKEQIPCRNVNDNQHSSQAQVKSELNEDERLCNGEIFFIINDVEINKVRELTITDEDRKYTLNYKALRSRSGLRHAWARTIHTFQGSEEDTVVYVLGSAGRQNWKHVYTAITRGRKRVYVVAKMNQLDQAISNKARERKTRLQQRLNEEFAQSRGMLNPTRQDTLVKANKDFGDKDLNVMPHSQPQTPPRFNYPSQQVTTPESSSHRERAAVSGNHSNEHVANCATGHSPVQKRAGVSIELQTPTKLSRVETCKDAMASPLACSSLQNLSISDSCQKKLFEP